MSLRPPPQKMPDKATWFEWHRWLFDLYKYIISLVGSTSIKGTGSFAGSTGTTITIGSTMSDATYAVSVTILTPSDGSVGEISITNRTVTTFKVKNTGHSGGTFVWVVTP